MASPLSLLSYLILTGAILTFSDHSSLSTAPFSLSSPPSLLPSRQIKLPQSSPSQRTEHPHPKPSAPRSSPSRPTNHPHPYLPQNPPSKHVEHLHPLSSPPQSSQSLQHPQLQTGRLSPPRLPRSPEAVHPKAHPRIQRSPPESEHPTRPTPSTFPRTNVDQEMAAIIEALIGAGDFGSWAGLLMAAATNQFPFPVLATFFVPDDVGLSGHDSNRPSIVQGLEFDPFLIPYHIIPQRLTFSDLQRCAINSRLPTLFPDHSVLITNNSASNFTVDASLVTHPDLYQNAAVVMHGVSAVFDYSRFGMPPAPVPPTPPLPRSPPFHPPVDIFTPDTWQLETSSSDGGKDPIRYVGLWGPLLLWVLG